MPALSANSACVSPAATRQVLTCLPNLVGCKAILGLPSVILALWRGGVTQDSVGRRWAVVMAISGRADLKARVTGLHNWFNPLRFTVEDVIAEDDRVAVRWTNAGTDSGGFMGIPPTGKEFGIAGIDVHVVRDGRMAEHWHVVDVLGQMQQLGLIPAPGGDPS